MLPYIKIDILAKEGVEKPNLMSQDAKHRKGTSKEAISCSLPVSYIPISIFYQNRKIFRNNYNLSKKNLPSPFRCICSLETAGIQVIADATCLLQMVSLRARFADEFSKSFTTKLGVFLFPITSQVLYCVSFKKGPLLEF